MTAANFMVSGNLRLNNWFPLHLRALMLLALLAVALPALADEEAAQGSIKTFQKTVDDLDHRLADPEIGDKSLRDDWIFLGELKKNLREAGDKAREQAAKVREELNSLGAPPADGQPPELADLAARRKLLNGRLAQADGDGKQSDLLLVQVDRLAERVKGLRRDRFTERVFSRSISPLTGDVWFKAGEEASSLVNKASGMLSERYRQFQKDGLSWSNGGRLLLMLFLGVILTFPLRSWLIRRFGYVALEGLPTYQQRFRASLFEGLIHALLPSMAAVAISFTLEYDNELADAGVHVARSILVGLICVFFVDGFCRTALAPHQPEWRLVPLSDDAARHMSRALTLLAVLFAFDWVVIEILTINDASLELFAVHKFLSSLAIAGVLLTLLQTSLWLKPGQTVLEPARQWLRIGLLLVVAAIPVCSLSGYVVLSRILANQLVLSVGLLALLTLAQRMTAEAVAFSLSSRGAVGQRLRSELGFNEDGAEILRFWLSALLQAIQFGLALLAMPLIWGYSRKDLAVWLESFLSGFNVGEFRISPASILLAILLFLVFLAITRIFQRTLDRTIFPQTRMDVGLRHSIRSGVGYIGFTLAVLVAVSTLGINLSNLAIIAGALSVGIGFGLQNIVNNFVSGLILLVERPIKAGDWVVVGEYQGHVKEISVRATELVTFDRASVFIPNSNLISGEVVNRTYSGAMGRIIVPFTSAREENPEKIRDMILEIARLNPNIRSEPAPLFLFKGFGDNCLNYELISFVDNVEQTLRINSELCFAIHGAFREHGVEMTSAQRQMRVGIDPGRMPNDQDNDDDGAVASVSEVRPSVS